MQRETDSQTLVPSRLQEKYALVINLNPSVKAAQSATSVAPLKRLGYFFDPALRRVVIKGKSLKYLELQKDSEKYPAFLQADLYQALLMEVDEKITPFMRPQSVVRSDERSLIGVHLQDGQSQFKGMAKGRGLKVRDVSAGVNFPLARKLTADFEGLSLVLTDHHGVAALASARGLPVWFCAALQEPEALPFSVGSEVLKRSPSVDLNTWLNSLLDKLQWELGEAAAQEAPPLPSYRLHRVEEGPLVLWPHGAELSEEDLWGYLFQFSSWALYFRREAVSYSSIVSRFAAFLLSRDLQGDQRFLLHSQFQSLSLVQERLEGLMQRSSGALLERELGAELKGLPFPRSFAMGWLGLKNDGYHPEPSLGLFYQVRLFVTHLKLQRQLLSQCLGMLEGETERIFSE